MKILKFKISQTECKITAVTNEGNLVLQKFGEDLISVNPLRNLKKSHHLYLALKKACKNSEYFNRKKTIASEGDIFEIKAQLKPFIGVELQTI